MEKVVSEDWRGKVGKSKKYSPSASLQRMRGRKRGEVQNGRCTGQKSPNENGPLRQKLMTGGSKKQDFHSTL